VCLLERGRPPAQCPALGLEVRLPARVSLVFGTLPRRSDHGLDALARVEVRQVGEVPVASVDENEPGRVPGLLRAERDGDLRAPREPDEEGRVHIERREQIGSNGGEPRRPVRVCRDRSRAAVAWCVGRDHTDREPIREQRPELIGVEPRAA
jgi:hypothetical protein